MKEALVKKAREMGILASEEVILSAYTTPMLRGLGLITGEEDKLRLTSDGQKIISALDEQGEPEATKKLCSLLCEKDAQTANIIQHLEERHYSAETRVSRAALAKELREVGVEGAVVSSTRFNSWITMLKYFGLVKSIGHEYYVDKSQLEVLRKGERIPSLPEFQKKLMECYGEAKSSMEGAAYVPIPQLRDCVTAKFEGLWGLRFDVLLRELIQSSQDLSFVPATYMEKTVGGISLGDKYYFFLAIFRK